jgi:hypothetical protein
VNVDRVSVRLVPEKDSDPEDVFVLSWRLRAELTQLDVLVGTESDNQAPSDAKGLADVLGLLSITLGAAQQLGALVDLALSWSERNRHVVEVSIGGDSIKLGAATPEQQKQIVAAWLARHDPAE